MKGYTPNGSEEVFVIKKYHEHLLLLISKVKKLLEDYYAKDQPKNQDCKSYQKKRQCTVRQMDGLR